MLASSDSLMEISTKIGPVINKKWAMAACCKYEQWQNFWEKYKQNLFYSKNRHIHTPRTQQKQSLLWVSLTT